MSYCRWSSDNFGCDLYVYEHVYGGYMVHVAANRPVGIVPPLVPLEDVQAFADSWKRQTDFLESCARHPIGLPHDGQNFHEGTLEGLRDRLLMLREVGYKFPDDVLLEINDEIEEKKSGHKTDRHYPDGI